MSRHCAGPGHSKLRPLSSDARLAATDAPSDVRAIYLVPTKPKQPETGRRVFGTDRVSNRICYAASRYSPDRALHQLDPDPNQLAVYPPVPWFSRASRSTAARRWLNPANKSFCHAQAEAFGFRMGLSGEGGGPSPLQPWVSSSWRRWCRCRRGPGWVRTRGRS
jgi:hypothetical protein